MKPQLFVILFQSRSGSTYLSSLLNSHPDVYCRYEDFDTIGPNQSKRQLLDFGNKIIKDPTIEQTQAHLHTLSRRHAKASGFKFKYPSQYSRYPEVFLWLLEQKQNVKVIHLERNNVVKRAISTQHLTVLRQNDRLVSANLVEQTRNEKINVDILKLLRFVEHGTQLRSELEYIASQFPHRITVEYDELLWSRDVLLQRIADFLDVEPFAEIESTFKKATSDDLEDIVENYEDLERALANTPFSTCLDHRQVA